MHEPELMDDETTGGDARDPATQKLETQSGYPRLIRERNLRSFCHETPVQDDEGNVELVKVRTTTEFVEIFNIIVVRLAEASANNALKGDRTTIMESDVQPLLELIEEYMES